MHVLIWIVVAIIVIGIIISLAEWVVEHIVQIILVVTYVVGLIMFPRIVVTLTLICVALLILGYILRGIGRWIERNIIFKFSRTRKQKVIKSTLVSQKIERPSSVLIEASLPDDIKSVIEEGNRYIQRIRKYNDEIKDEEVSAKLDKLEGLMFQIFSELSRSPEKLRDMNRLNNYYLPTIEKLVKSYSELDNYEYQASNMLEMKAEISKSLDDANHALSELINDLFVFDKIEVQSDITVMKNMFERDGISKS